MTDTPTTETETHAGSCHCGAVRYEVKLDLSRPVTACNCSICSKTGSLLAFVPADHFALVAGEDEVTDYQFNQKVVHHYFCRTCGIRSFARGTGPDGQEMAAINVRCLDGVDLESLEIRHYDGKSS